MKKIILSLLTLTTISFAQDHAILMFHCEATRLDGSNLVIPFDITVGERETRIVFQEEPWFREGKIFTTTYVSAYFLIASSENRESALELPIHLFKDENQVGEFRVGDGFNSGLGKYMTYQYACRRP